MINKITDFDSFNSLDIRVGTILKANEFKEAIKPSYKLVIDFGPLGKLNSSAQITNLYSPKDLIGKQIIAVVNIGNRKIANYNSQCLVLGATTNKGVRVLTPEISLKNGTIIQ